MGIEFCALWNGRPLGRVKIEVQALWLKDPSGLLEVDTSSTCNFGGESCSEQVLCSRYQGISMCKESEEIYTLFAFK